MSLSRRRGILYLTGALILAVPVAVWMIASVPVVAKELAMPAVRSPVDSGVDLAADVLLGRRDPMALVQRGWERYQDEVDGYRCVLVKQERLDGKLSAVQEVEVRFHESPRMIYMLWLANADQARRALFMECGDFVDKKGRKLARVEPAGAIARLFVKDTYVPIDGPEARKSSRRSIDECGFGATFELLKQFNAIAAERGVLDLRYEGVGEVDHRPTYVIVRDLPYDGPDGVYPDARMVLHLDQEWLLPVAVYSYADRAQHELLGSYVFTQVELNPHFGADAFKF